MQNRLRKVGPWLPFRQEPSNDAGRRSLSAQARRADGRPRARRSKALRLVESRGASCPIQPQKIVQHAAGNLELSAVVAADCQTVKGAACDVFGNRAADWTLHGWSPLERMRRAGNVRVARADGPGGGAP